MLKSVRIHQIRRTITISGCAVLTAWLHDAQAEEQAAARTVAQPPPATAHSPAEAPRATGPETIELDTVTVLGYAAQSEQAVATKRNGEGIMESITSDDANQQPDYNVADALSHVPFVQTELDEDEGKYVSIRGLDKSFTMGSFDGATIAASGSTRALDVSVIPTTMVRRSDVKMTRTPDMEGNAIGGAFDLRSRSAFDRNGRTYAVANISAGMSDGTGVPGANYNRDGDDGPSFRADGTASFTFGETRSWGFLISGSMNHIRRDQERWQPGANSGNDFVNTEPAPPPVSNASFWGNGYAMTSDRYGLTGKLEYYPSEAFRAALTYSQFLQQDHEIRLSQLLRSSGYNTLRFNDFNPHKPLNVAMASVRWQPGQDHVISGQLSYSDAAPSEYTNQLEFHTVAPYPTFHVWVDEDGIERVGNISPQYNDPSRYQFYRYTPLKTQSEQEVREGRLDWAFNRDNHPGWGFQTGVKWRSTESSTEQTETVYCRVAAPCTSPYAGLTAEPFLSDAGYFDQLVIDYNKWDSYFTRNAHSFDVLQTDTLINSIGADYGVKEEVMAAYALVELRSQKHRLIIGGRWEGTRTRVTGWSYTGDGGSLSDYSRVAQTSSYNDFLPSITYTWNAAADWKVRLAYFEGVGRADPSQLRTSQSVTLSEDGDDLATISRGNPNLKPRRGRSYDGAVEWYLPDDSGLLSLGIFHKDITNLIYNLRTTEVVDGDDVDIIQPRNAARATINGAGVSYSLSKLRELGFMPGFLSDFGTTLNYTYLDGSTTTLDEDGSPRALNFLPLMARQTANGALFYQRRGFSSRVSYSWVSDSARTVGSTEADDRWLRAQGIINLQARYSLNRNVGVVAEVRNLLADNKLVYRNADIGGRRHQLVTDDNYYGRQYWLGVSLRY